MNLETQFLEVKSLIDKARYRAFKSVNSELISLYWQVGEYISKKVESAEWGMSIVDKLAEYLQKTQHDLKGFNRRGLYRMKQFYETYKDCPEILPLLQEVSWSGNLHILSKTKSMEEKKFYLQLSAKEKYSVRELERQINTAYYERYMLSDKKVSTLLTQIHPEVLHTFKDTYILDFLSLPSEFSEKDLRKAITKNLKSFILEFGKDFAFIGEEYRIQVGNNDYYIDLLFYHRDLCCLVLFELKIDDFKPEYLGKLNFYLEALDREGPVAVMRRLPRPAADDDCESVKTQRHSELFGIVLAEQDLLRDYRPTWNAERTSLTFYDERHPLADHGVVLRRDVGRFHVGDSYAVSECESLDELYVAILRRRLHRPVDGAALGAWLHRREPNLP